MNQSTSISALSKALVSAQSEFAAVPMKSTNPFFKSKYANLGDVIETCKPILKKNGLAVSQLVEGENSQVGVTTVLLHESGEFISSHVVIPVVGQNVAQEAGKAITYLRRYSLASILGLYADEDADAETDHKPAKHEPAKVDASSIVVPDKTTPNDYWKLVRITLKWDEAKSKALLERCGGDFEMAFVEAKKEAEAK
jgi:hypothetical protein